MATPTLTDEQLQEAVDAKAKYGTDQAAANAIGLRSRAALQSRLAQAALKGIAPGHFDSGVAPGYKMGKVTVQRGPNGEVELVGIIMSRRT